MLPSETNHGKEVKRIRLRLYKEHLGYINPLFLETFQETCQVKRLNTWIKQRAYQEFGLYIESRADIAVLNQILAERFYENPAEWVKEMMRREMYPSAQELEN